MKTKIISKSMENNREILITHMIQFLLPLKKLPDLCDVIIVTRPIFYDVGKYLLRVFLNDCLYKLAE